ncbi:MAG: slipin family protein [Dehalococcoidales bacterium]|jgi:regulator of protease activity HflC (stomatin/prohibitin superfamily)|nr:slipin family protein [Dehalococcoidales bacterium]NLT27832.1 slipin family protein [Dehalococcoidales bacterium]
MDNLYTIVPIVVAVLAILFMSVKVVSEYERGVIFRLGRLIGGKGPGLFFLIPFIDRMVKVDLRVITMDVPSQEVITKDNVTVRVNAVIYFRVVDPEASVVKVLDHIRATSQISQTTLRNVLGQSELDELLAEREKLNQTLQSIIDEHTDPWGVKVSTVEIKEVELPETMRRSMAAQAEAERERRAKIIHAEGEFQASQKLADAATIIAKEPVTLQLRYLQTLTEIASEKNSTLVFPLPIDLISMFMKKEDK